MLLFRLKRDSNTVHEIGWIHLRLVAIAIIYDLSYSAKIGRKLLKCNHLYIVCIFSSRLVPRYRVLVRAHIPYIYVYIFVCVFRGTRLYSFSSRLALRHRVLMRAHIPHIYRYARCTFRGRACAAHAARLSLLLCLAMVHCMHDTHIPARACVRPRERERAWCIQRAGAYAVPAVYSHLCVCDVVENAIPVMPIKCHTIQSWDSDAERERRRSLICVLTIVPRRPFVDRISQGFYETLINIHKTPVYTFMHIVVKGNSVMWTQRVWVLFSFVVIDRGERKSSVGFSLF